MFKPVKVVDVELSHALKDIENAEGYGALKVLVRWHGSPLGYAHVPLSGGCCQVSALRQVILDQLGSALLQRKLYVEMVEAIRRNEMSAGSGLNKPAESNRALPVVTVAVCTRDRASALSLCLSALTALAYARLDLLLIDNAPGDDAAERLLKTEYPNIRYEIGRG